MKLFILLLVIFFVLLLFRLFQIKLKSSANQEKKDQNIVDLEKDPKTNEYKPKKQIVISLQSIIMKPQIRDVIESLKDTLDSDHYGF